jgi:hypothetical protein
MEHVAQLLFTGKSPADGSRNSGYPDYGGAFIDNARRRANRRDVKAAAADLQERAACAAEVDQTSIPLELRDLLSFNVDDYLTLVQLRSDGTVDRRRRIDISCCTP